MLPLLDLFGFFRRDQRSRDGFDRGTCLDGGRAGDVGDQGLLVLFAVPQIRVGFKQGLVTHVLILT